MKNIKKYALLILLVLTSNIYPSRDPHSGYKRFKSSEISGMTPTEEPEVEHIMEAPGMTPTEGHEVEHVMESPGVEMTGVYIPGDVLSNVLQYVPKNVILKLRKTNKAFKEFVEKSDFLKEGIRGYGEVLTIGPTLFANKKALESTLSTYSKLFILKELKLCNIPIDNKWLQETLRRFKRISKIALIGCAYINKTTIDIVRETKGLESLEVDEGFVGSIHGRREETIQSNETFEPLLRSKIRDIKIKSIRAITPDIFKFFPKTTEKLSLALNFRGDQKFNYSEDLSRLENLRVLEMNPSYGQVNILALPESIEDIYLIKFQLNFSSREDFSRLKNLRRVKLERCEMNYTPPFKKTNENDQAADYMKFVKFTLTLPRIEGLLFPRRRMNGMLEVIHSHGRSKDILELELGTIQNDYKFLKEFINLRHLRLDYAIPAEELLALSKLRIETMHLSFIQTQYDDNFVEISSMLPDTLKYLGLYCDPAHLKTENLSRLKRLENLMIISNSYNRSEGRISLSNFSDVADKLKSFSVTRFKTVDLGGIEQFKNLEKLHLNRIYSEVNLSGIETLESLEDLSIENISIKGNPVKYPARLKKLTTNIRGAASRKLIPSYDYLRTEFARKPFETEVVIIPFGATLPDDVFFSGYNRSIGFKDRFKRVRKGK